MGKTLTKSQLKKIHADHGSGEAHAFNVRTGKTIVQSPHEGSQIINQLNESIIF